MTQLPISQHFHLHELGEGIYAAIIDLGLCRNGIAYTETELSLLTDVAERLGHVLSLMDTA